jgi:hypothetical protein
VEEEIDQHDVCRSGLAAGHEGETLEKVHVLLVLE